MKTRQLPGSLKVAKTQAQLVAEGVSFVMPGSNPELSARMAEAMARNAERPLPGSTQNKTPAENLGDDWDNSGRTL